VHRHAATHVRPRSPCPTAAAAPVRGRRQHRAREARRLRTVAARITIRADLARVLHRDAPARRRTASRSADAGVVAAADRGGGRQFAWHRRRPGRARGRHRIADSAPHRHRPG
jgi:hypothetical protein